MLRLGPSALQSAASFKCVARTSRAFAANLRIGLIEVVSQITDVLRGVATPFLDSAAKGSRGVRAPTGQEGLGHLGFADLDIAIELMGVGSGTAQHPKDDTYQPRVAPKAHRSSLQETQGDALRECAIQFQVCRRRILSRKSANVAPGCPFAGLGVPCGQAVSPGSHL